MASLPPNVYNLISMKRIWNSLTRSLFVKITASLTVMLLLGVTTVATVFMMVNTQKTDGMVINEAGRLRMLSQRMAKATFMIASDYEGARDELLAAAALFDKGLNGVRYGDAEMGIPPVSEQVEPQLEKVAQRWDTFQANIELLANADQDSVMLSQAVAEVGAANLELLDEANNAVKLLEQEASMKVNKIFTFLFIILALDVVFFSVILFVVRRMIRPITQLADLSERVAQGDVSVSAEVKTQDELGQLGEAFNRMLTKIRRNVNEWTGFLDLMVRTSDESDVDRTLQIFLKSAKEMTSAKYAALSVFGDNGKVERFFTLGVPDEMKQRIGRLPEGKGLLGHLQKTKRILRLDDMASHAASVGFPAGHVPMKALLAAPILYGDQVLGNLYLADKEETEVFDDDDEQVIRNSAKLIGVMVNAKVVIQENERVRRYLQEETNKLVNVIDRLAEGDFAVEIDATNHGDEISRLRLNLRKMVTGLRQLIAQVRQAVGDTTTMSVQINTSTEALAAGGQEQSVQAQEVAAAVEEMTQTIIENARNASHSAELGDENGRIAREGSEVVQQTVAKIKQIAGVVRSSSETIERLGASSDQIGEIIEVIDDIASQTNLLALNAAIEAARAGEQGRGFAVVADEVSKLAERTTSATRQIADMISTIQIDTREAVQAMQQGNKEVEEGIELADRAGTALDRIVAGVQQVVDVVNQIAAASEEQSTTSEQISRSVEAISTVSTEAAMGIAQISQSADQLRRETDTLREVVDRFKLNEQGAFGPKPRIDRAPEPRPASPELSSLDNIWQA